MNGFEDRRFPGAISAIDIIETADEFDRGRFNIPEIADIEGF